LINGGANDSEVFRHAVERFRMADDEMSAWLEAGQEIGNHLALGFGVEVNHHIAQENDFEIADGSWNRLGQVDLL